MGGINWEIGIDIYTFIHIKQTTNKNLMDSTGNSTQWPILEKNLLKKSGYMYICI